MEIGQHAVLAHGDDPAVETVVLGGSPTVVPHTSTSYGDVDRVCDCIAPSANINVTKQAS